MPTYNETMEIRSWGNTDIGLKRQVNQDSILLDKDLGLYIVADGMGGHRGGGVASVMAIKAAQEVFKQSHQMGLSPKEAIALAYSEANAQIFQRSAQEEELSGMGTTMVLVYFDKDAFFVGNIGDSRAYLFQNDFLWQMTEDHSLVNEQLRAGVIKEDHLDKAASKNVITRSVGFEREVSSDIFERKIQRGDGILLCSDGLTGMVSNRELLLLHKKFKGEKFIQKSIEAAKKNGGDDNISVIYIEIIH